MSCPYAEYNNKENNNREDMSNDGYYTIENMVNEVPDNNESKLPGVMSFLSPSLFNIQPGFNSCIYLQTLHKKLDTAFKENINTQKVPIPPGVNYISYFNKLHNELTDIISMKLDNIQQLRAPSMKNPTHCNSTTECMFTPLRTFNKEIENINFNNIDHIQAVINEIYFH